MKIFVDFDEVLFDTSGFLREIKKVFKQHGFTEEEFKKTYDEFAVTSKHAGTLYNFDRHVEFAEELKEVKLPTLRKALDSLMQNLKKFTFPDVRKFLLSFDRSDLFLLSYGDIEFQMKKINLSGVGRFFDHIFINERDKFKSISEIKKKFKVDHSESIFLIDDMPENLEKTEKEDKAIKTIYLCRPEGKNANRKCEWADFKATNLLEAKKIILNNN